MLRIICEHWLPFRHFCQLVLMSAVEDRLWALFGYSCQLVLTSEHHWGPFILGKCLFGTLYWSPSERVYDGSVIWCVSVYFICVIGILVAYVKWEIQLQFIKKNFSCEFMTKKGRWFFLGGIVYSYSILQTPEKVKMKVLKLKKKGFFLHMQLEKAYLIKHFFQTLRKQKHALEKVWGWHLSCPWDTNTVNFASIFSLGLTM